MPQRRAGLVGAITLIILLLALIALRGLLLYTIVNGLTDCAICMGATAAQQDASLLALLLLFIGLSLLTRRYWLQLPWLVLSAALLTLYATDLAVLQTLTQRLYLFDLIKFGKELGAIVQFSNIFLATGVGKLALLVGVIGAIVLILALLPRPYRPLTALACLISAGLLALLGHWQPTTMKYIHYELLQNVLAANLDLGVDKSYSPAFAAKIVNEYVPPTPLCEPGQGLHPNIIVIAVESLSMHHSALFGGIRDLTPRLDAIAREHSYIPDFIANGFTTDGGLIAMITGHAPIPAIGRYQSTNAFFGFDNATGAVPDVLHPFGYSSHFFTTGNLGFLDKPTWLKALHFDSWEGSEQAYYLGWKRRHFDAAEDKALYQRFLQWMDGRKTDHSPYFAFILTVSTHPPFVNPETDAQDEPGAFRYADQQIGMFYDELQKRDFFRNGILMISGDHRSMTPLTSAEQSRFGDSALARTPFVVATDLPIARGAITGKFQQADIPPSIADLVADESCVTAGQGRFLRSAPQPAQFIEHARGDRRDSVDIYFGERQQARILLTGDDTRWEGPRPDNWQNIMDGISLERIKRGNANENLIDVVVGMRAAQKPATANE